VMKALVLPFYICIARAALLRQRSSTVLSGLEKAQPDAAAVLSSLLKEFQSEQKAAGSFQEGLHQWCQRSASQKQIMAETMQRKVDESNIMLEQIKSETTRLESELSLIQTNKQEKMQQMMEANDTESFVAQEYSKELKDMDKTIEAARHAVRLASQNTDHRTAQSVIAADAGMTDVEKNVKDLNIDDLKPTDSDRPQELANALNDILGKLESDRSAAADGHEGADRKATSFVEHLNSSIFEINSQVASIEMDIAQRHREQIRLEGQVSDVLRLLNTIKDSRQNTKTTCVTYLQGQVQLAKFVNAEIDAAKAVLEQASPESSEMFLATSFFQMQQKVLGRPIWDVQGDLTSIAEKYPDQAAWYLSVANSLDHVAAPRMSLAEHNAKPAEKSSSASSSDNEALQDIQRFVAANSENEDQGDAVALSGEARPLLSDPAEVQKIKSSYAALLTRIQTKQSSVQDNEKWCELAIREAKLDHTKTVRTVNRMKARLNLAQDTESNYQKDSMYYASQGKLLVKQREMLMELSSEADRQHSKAYGALSAFSKQLMSVATEMSELLTGEERRVAEMTKSLIEKIQNHQTMLEVNHKIWDKSKTGLLQADEAIQTVLGKNVRHNGQRIIRSQIQSQFLASRLHLRQQDTALSEDFKDFSQEMCSDQKMEALKGEVDSLRKQVGELQQSFSENVAAFA